MKKSIAAAPCARPSEGKREGSIGGFTSWVGCLRCANPVSGCWRRRLGRKCTAASAEVAGTAATSATDLPQPGRAERTAMQLMRIDSEAFFRIICVPLRLAVLSCVARSGYLGTVRQRRAGNGGVGMDAAAAQNPQMASRRTIVPRSTPGEVAVHKPVPHETARAWRTLNRR